MTDHYDEMRVSPDPAQAEDCDSVFTHSSMRASHLDPDELVAMKEIYVSLTHPPAKREAVGAWC